jgi:hypothetical protein
MLLVEAINLGLNLRMPALDQDRESPTSRPERNQSNRISCAGRLAKTSASAVSASLRGSRGVLQPTTISRPQNAHQRAPLSQDG